MDILDILWDAHQQRRIWRAEDSLQSAHLTLDTLRDRLADVMDRLEHANLVTLALWELVGERLGLTVDQLRSKVAEIDLRDGVQDGRYGGEIPTRTGCGRQVHLKRQRCMYCGFPRRGLGTDDALAERPRPAEPDADRM